MDWAFFEDYTVLEDGKREKLFCFPFILGYSRERYIEFVTDMSTNTLIRCHANAFRYFGSYPEEILYDNMKQVVIKRLLEQKDSTLGFYVSDFQSDRPLLITDTILRDAHQSQEATRMRLSDVLPACEVLDSVGYYSLEYWGGATFDTCMRFLNENPWMRLRTLCRMLPHTKLQMLLRGQNLPGYQNYPDDVVDAFFGKSIENGIDIIRVFDALNDTRNLEQSVQSIKKYGGQVEASLSYTVSPVHDEAYFVKLAGELEQMGADTICIKDMVNLLLPMKAYSLVKKFKETVSVPTHNTIGTGDMVYLMAVLAGVNIVDTALSPLANGTSQPTMESLVATLQGTPRDTGLDLGKMSRAAAHFRTVAARLQNEGLSDPKVLRVDVNTLMYQVPGGMLSHLLSQLKQMGKTDKFEEVLAENPRVHKDFGYPPMVTRRPARSSVPRRH